MQVSERKNEQSCMGKKKCGGIVKLEIDLADTKLLLCETCASNLYKALSSYIVPKPIKSKFYNQ
ncbi:MAG: hypothetical protein IKQ31_02850 [Clostridia bacterium]|nr:hypothetical protein [Clostridia bacterium]